MIWPVHHALLYCTAGPGRVVVIVAVVMKKSKQKSSTFEGPNKNVPQRSNSVYLLQQPQLSPICWWILVCAGLSLDSPIAIVVTRPDTLKQGLLISTTVDQLVEGGPNESCISILQLDLVNTNILTYSSNRIIVVMIVCQQDHLADYFWLSIHRLWLKRGICYSSKRWTNYFISRKWWGWLLAPVSSPHFSGLVFDDIRYWSCFECDRVDHMQPFAVVYPTLSVSWAEIVWPAGINKLQRYCIYAVM